MQWENLADFDEICKTNKNHELGMFTKILSRVRDSRNFNRELGNS